MSSKNTQQFSGGQESLDRHIRMYKRLGVPFKIIKKGSVSEFHYGGNILRFVTVSHGKGSGKIGAVCRVVMNEVDRYMESNPILDFELRTTNDKNTLMFNKFIMSGERDIYMVDVNACYWNILHNAGIISENVYGKYREDKYARLVAVGNLKKSTHVMSFNKGSQSGSTVVIPNPRAWVWDYVVFKAYEIFEQVNDYIDHRTMMYKTDCFFVAKNDIEKVQYKLKQLGFESSVEKRTVVGQYKGKVITVDEVGELRYSGFISNSRAMLSLLPHVEMDDRSKISQKEEDEIEKELNSND